VKYGKVMSRIGRQLIKIPEGVTLKIENQHLIVKGPLGEMFLTLNPAVKIFLEKDIIRLEVENPQEKFQKALWGTSAKLISNAILGVTKKFEKKLEIIGIGFRAEVKEGKLIIHVGYSHPIEYSIPPGIEIKTEKNSIIISGVNKELVGQVAARIREFRKPEPYKGTGIKYANEVVRKKAGKKAVAQAA